MKKNHLTAMALMRNAITPCRQTDSESVRDKTPIPLISHDCKSCFNTSCNYCTWWIWICALSSPTGAKAEKPAEWISPHCSKNLQHFECVYTLFYISYTNTTHTHPKWPMC